MESAEAIAALGSLAQETRLDAFRALIKAGPEGLPASAIAEVLDVPATTLSFHLNHLMQAGLIARRRDGRWLWYSARYDTVEALIGFLMKDCCQGAPVSARSGKRTANQV